MTSSKLSFNCYSSGSGTRRLNVSYGVPPGSILGHLLFIIFNNDLPLHVRMQDVNLDLYANDTTLSLSTDINTFDKVQVTLNYALKDVEDCITVINSL